MASFNPSPLISSISGSLQGLTFKNTRSGPIICKRLTRTNQLSQPQLKRRARYTFLLKAWSLISDNQRAGWTSYASNLHRTNPLGVSRAPSPFNIFIAHNVTDLRIFPYYVLDAPTHEQLQPPVDPAINATASFAVFIALIQPNTPPLVRLVIQGFRPFRTTPSPYPNQWLEFFNSDIIPGPHLINLNPSWQPTFGHPTVNEFIYMRARLWHPLWTQTPWTNLSTQTLP